MAYVTPQPVVYGQRWTAEDVQQYLVDNPNALHDALTGGGSPFQVDQVIVGSEDSTAKGLTLAAGQFPVGQGPGMPVKASPSPPATGIVVLQSVNGAVSFAAVNLSGGANPLEYLGYPGA